MIQKKITFVCDCDELAVGEEFIRSIPRRSVARALTALAAGAGVAPGAGAALLTEGRFTADSALKVKYKMPIKFSDHNNCLYTYY